MVVSKYLHVNCIHFHLYFHCRCDVTKREDVFALADKILTDVGHVSIIVNNAGIMPCHSLLKHNADEIRKMFDINVLAHIWVLQAFLPHMFAKRRGHIVAISSMAGLCGLTNLVPYCATKFAVRGLMEALYEELREDGLHQAVCICFLTVFRKWH